MNALEKQAQWNNHTALLRSQGFKSAGSENDPTFKRPTANDWTSFYYGESCITLYVSPSLQLYTILDSGD